MGLREAIPALAIFFTLQFLIIFFGITIMGTPDQFGVNQPLEFISDICLTAGTTPNAMAVALFVLGTLANTMLMFVLAGRSQH